MIDCLTQGAVAMVEEAMEHHEHVDPTKAPEKAAKASTKVGILVQLQFNVSCQTLAKSYSKQL